MITSCIVRELLQKFASGQGKLLCSQKSCQSSRLKLLKLFFALRKHFGFCFCWCPHAYSATDCARRCLLAWCCCCRLVSGSSGGLKYSFGIGPVEMDSPSLRTNNGLSNTVPLKRFCSNVFFPLIVSMHGSEQGHIVFRSSGNLFRCHVRTNPFRTMLIPTSSPVVG